MSREQIREIPGFPNRFLTKNFNVVNQHGELMTWSETKSGYLRCSSGRGMKPLYQHRAVALVYFGEPAVTMDVDHIDGDKHNNDPSNLRWMTRKQNMQAYFDRKRAAANKKFKEAA